MKKGIRSLPAILITALACFSSCTPEEEFSGNAHIEAAFRLESFKAMDGRVTINEAFLKLDRIQTTGNLRGKNILDLSHSISPEDPPFKLGMADSSTVNFALTSKAFELLDFHLFLFQDNYQLLINTKEDGSPPAGDDGEEDEDDSGNDGEGSDGQDGNGGGHDGDGGDEGNGGDEDDENEDGDGDHGDDDGDKEDDGGGGHNDNQDEDDDGEDNDDDDKDDDEDKDGDDDDDDDEDKDDDGGKDDDDDDDKNKGKGKNKNKDDDDDGGDDRSSASGTVRTVDLDHFFQNAKPAMVVFGLYQNNGVTLNIIFAASGIEKFSVRAKQNDSFTIALEERNSAEVTFEPERWFESLTPADIESASVQTYQQQQVLFIHKDFNTALYERLVSRIEESAGLTIRKSNAKGF